MIVAVLLQFKMNKNDLTRELAKAGYTDVSIVEIEECRVDRDRHGEPFYPRDHQLDIWRGRLRGSKLLEQGKLALADDQLGAWRGRRREFMERNKKTIPIMEEWVRNFESLDSETPLFFWKATCSDGKFSGRCTVDAIIQILPVDWHEQTNA